jgi:hypothetical protein
LEIRKIGIRREEEEEEKSRRRKRLWTGTGKIGAQYKGEDGRGE